MLIVIVSLYQGSSEAKKLILKDKVRSIKMSKQILVVSYLTKFSKVKEELDGVDETVPYRDLINFTILGFTKLWRGFTDRICAREHFPVWERFVNF